MMEGADGFGVNPSTAAAMASALLRHMEHERMLWICQLSAHFGDRYSIVFHQFVLEWRCESSREIWQRRLTVCVERESRRVSDAEHDDEDIASQVQPRWLRDLDSWLQPSTDLRSGLSIPTGAWSLNVSLRPLRILKLIFSSLSSLLSLFVEWTVIGRARAAIDHTANLASAWSMGWNRAEAGASQSRSDQLRTMRARLVKKKESLEISTSGHPPPDTRVLWLGGRLWMAPTWSTTNSMISISSIHYL